MLYPSIASLPANIREMLLSEEDARINDSIQADFALDRRQFLFFLQVVLDTILGRSEVLDLPTRLTKMPGAKDIDIRALALRIAIDKLWPLQEFLKNVDVLINRLGGRVPAPIPLPTVQEEDVEADEPEIPQPTWVQGSAKEILQDRFGFAELYLTQKPMHDADGRLRAPTVTNWLQDYLHTVGAAGTGSLKRSQYLAKSTNAVSLNEAEKKNLLNFLVSYEENMPMYWKVAEEQFLLVEDMLPTEVGAETAPQKTARQMSELVEQYASMQREYRSQFDERKPGLELEINGNVKKLADILWDAMGLGETDRALATIDLLIDRHWLLEMLKTDHRYQGIVGRSIGVRYGIEAKNTWNGDATTTVMLGIFWRLILVEKLGLDESRAAILADHYRKRLEQKVSPVYLDLKSGKFLFREIAYKDRAFSFV